MISSVKSTIYQYYQNFAKTDCVIVRFVSVFHSKEHFTLIIS